MEQAFITNTHNILSLQRGLTATIARNGGRIPVWSLRSHRHHFRHLLRQPKTPAGSGTEEAEDLGPVPFLRAGSDRGNGFEADATIVAETVQD